MTFSQLLDLMSDSNCSPEEFGERIGISGMTLRRWLKKPKRESIPKVYIPAVREACFQLMAEGRLTSDMSSVRVLTDSASPAQMGAALQSLGLNQAFSLDGGALEQALLALSQIGSQVEKQNLVTENRKKVFSFRAISGEWSKRVMTLWKIIQSRQLTTLEKLIGYGALFYLLTPIDFIPDQIPMVGLTDDFVVLGIAVSYYVKRFSEFL